MTSKSLSPASCTLEQVARQIASIESRLAELSHKITTNKLVLEDNEGAQRFVAETIDGVFEARIELFGAGAGRTSLLFFSAPNRDHLPQGLGVQLWSDGDVVDEMTWWEEP